MTTKNPSFCRKIFTSFYYGNLPKQYTETFSAFIKNEIFIGYILIILICMPKTLIVGTR